MNNRIRLLLAADSKHLLLVADVRLVERRSTGAQNSL